MKQCLLKRVLPFTLTFLVGAAVGGFFQLLGAGGAGWGGPRYYRFENRRGCGKKFQRNYFAPETKPPVILFKPDARWPEGLAAESRVVLATSVRVTFGEDGRVREAETLDPYLPREAQEAAARAARQVRFMPETVGGEPVAATREITIRFLHD